MKNTCNNEKNMTGENFVASFSGGKDSMLAIFRCIKKGMTPLGMITTCPYGEKKSWFHKISEENLILVSKSINIPISFIKTSPEDYVMNFEKALLKAKENGAKYIVFGDIDIEEHITWCTERCINTDTIPYFPLWKQNREALVKEFIDFGFKSIIISTNHEKLKEGFEGEVLTRKLIKKMKLVCEDIDICGENGEYHTFVTDGPLFSFPIKLV